MSEPERTAAEAAREIADALTSAGHDYAIRGALALGVAGVPRGTLDVDVNLFVSDDALAPEAIAVLEQLFFRIEDRGDLERLVAVRGRVFDHEYVRRWIVEMMGDDDERVRAWDDIVARFGPS